MLDVERGEHVDAGVEQLLDVLPALLVAAARGVGVRELVDQDHRRAPGQHGVDVQLRHPVPRYSITGADDLEVAELLGGAGAAVGLDHGRRPRRCRARGAGAPRRASRRSCRRRAPRRGRSCSSPALACAHRAGPASRNSSPRHHPPAGRRSRIEAAVESEREVQFEHVDPPRPEEPELAALGVLRRPGHGPGPRQAVGRGDPRDLQLGVLGADVRVDTGARSPSLRRPGRAEGSTPSRAAICCAPLLDEAREQLAARPWLVGRAAAGSPGAKAVVVRDRSRRPGCGRTDPAAPAGHLRVDARPATADDAAWRRRDSGEPSDRP